MLLTADPGASSGAANTKGGEVQNPSAVSPPADPGTVTNNLPSPGAASDPSQLSAATSGQAADSSSSVDLTTGLSGDSLASTSAIDQVFAQL